MIYGEDPLRSRSRNIDGQVKKTGKVCLNGGISGQMAFQKRTDLQNQGIGWLRKGCRSLGGGSVVWFLQSWKSSGKCQVRLFGVFGLVGFRYILDAETEHERGLVAMAEDYQQKYVGLVAAVIGGVVLFLGLVGIIVNLS